MNRLLAVLALVGITGVAVADIAPPKGIKRISVEHKITTDKDFPEYEFFNVVGGKDAKPVKFDTKNPAVVTGTWGSFRFAKLVAVPKDAGKTYPKKEDFYKAIVDGKVEGQVGMKNTLTTLTTVKDADTRKAVVEEYKLEKINPKEGIVIKGTKKEDGPTSAPPKSGSKPPEEEEESLAAGFAPKGGVWVAGLAATAAVVLAGLWFARRGRRELA